MALCDARRNQNTVGVAHPRRALLSSVAVSSLLLVPLSQQSLHTHTNNRIDYFQNVTKRVKHIRAHEVTDKKNPIFILCYLRSSKRPIKKNTKHVLNIQTAYRSERIHRNEILSHFVCKRSFYTTSTLDCIGPDNDNVTERPDSSG